MYHESGQVSVFLKQTEERKLQLMNWKFARREDYMLHSATLSTVIRFIICRSLQSKVANSLLAFCAQHSNNTKVLRLICMQRSLNERW